MHLFPITVEFAPNLILGNTTTAAAWHRSTWRKVCETDQAGAGKLPLFPIADT